MTHSLLPSVFDNGSKIRPAFRSLHKEIDRVFDDFRGMITGIDAVEPFDEDGNIMPRLNIVETDNEVEITAELPGVKEADIDVSATGNVLTLKGEKSSEREEGDGKEYKLVERTYGSFARTIPFAFDIDSKKVDATFADGVLTVTIAKPADAKDKVQKIKVSKAA